MPTANEIEVRVIGDVSVAANLPTSAIAVADVIADLGVDHFGFIFIAGSLRSYIKLFKPANTLRVDEVERDGLTIAALRDLVAGRVQ